MYVIEGSVRGVPLRTPLRRAGRRLALGAAAAALALPVAVAPATAKAPQTTCSPGDRVLRASDAQVAGLTTQQVHNASAIVNAGADLHVTAFGQTVAVMTALEETSLTNLTHGDAQRPDARGLFAQGDEWGSASDRTDPTASAKLFYTSLLKVKNWQNLPPSLAAHAAQRNLDPDAYAKYWSKAQTVVNDLTTGTGPAGLRNLAAAAQAVADCEAATSAGKFAYTGGYVGPYPPDQLYARARDLALNGGNGWFERCQGFVAVLDGKPHSGYDTALDAWHTFQARGVAHAVTSPDGVAPPPGAWLYYTSSNPAGHVATYLGNGMVASTDVFARGRVGVGPASALTNGPWHLRYLGWAPPWGAYA